MTEDVEGAAQLRARFERLAPMTQEELAQRAGVNRDTVSAVLNGKHARKAPLVIKALAAAEEEAGLAGIPLPVATTTGEGDTVTFQVTGNFGVSVTVKGPVSDAAILEPMVLRLIQGLHREEPADPSSDTDP